MISQHSIGLNRGQNLIGGQTAGQSCVGATQITAELGSKSNLMSGQIWTTLVQSAVDVHDICRRWTETLQLIQHSRPCFHSITPIMHTITVY